jgi:antitoxin VapB
LVSTIVVEAPWGEEKRAKLFMHGRSQAVRLPKEFRLPGKEVRVRRVGRGVLLEPVEPVTEEEVKAWFAKLDRMGAHEFLPEGRPEQPLMPDGDDIDFDR